MKSRTPLILVGIHVAAFVLLFSAKVLPGAVGNFFVAIGLCVEFPGWFLGSQWFSGAGTGAIMGFAFLFNACLYAGGGLMIDAANRPR
jgi:hypothetical protein